MSIIERLTEGVVNRDMKAEGAALLNKWKRTGLLEGLSNDRSRQSMARLLENQAKELLRESSSMSAGDVEGFASVAFPIVRRVFAGLIANDLVSVQPMSLPAGLIFFLDFVFSPDLNGVAQTGSRTGNSYEKSIYGTNQVGSQVTGGVDLVSSVGADFSGPRSATARGYAYASPTSSMEVAAGTLRNVQAFSLDAATNSEKKIIQYDPDLLSLSGSGTTHAVAIITVPAGSIPTDLDADNFAPVQLNDGSITGQTGLGSALTNANQVRRLTRTATAADVNSGVITSLAAGDLMFFVSAVSGTGTTQINVGAADNQSAAAALTASYALVDNITSGGALGTVVGAAEWGLEGSAEIPEIDIKVDSIAVTAQTKKLKAKWTPELGQDLNAYHNLDAEVELTGILSEQIALEIDREILADLVNGATAATYYWSRSPGLFVNRETGAEIGASAAAPDFTGTVSEWYETLVETINDVSAQIHRKTLRGGANFIVCGPEVANVLEFTSGFRASVTHDDESGSIGAIKAGSLSKKFDVIVDPYFLRNVILVGRRGASFLESGYVYAPYVPLQTTPTIFGPEDFVPRKGVMTRYAKQMVRPDMYGLVIVRGMIGESGS